MVITNRSNIRMSLCRRCRAKHTHTHTHLHISSLENSLWDSIRSVWARCRGAAHVSTCSKLENRIVVIDLNKILLLLLCALAASIYMTFPWDVCVWVARHPHKCHSTHHSKPCANPFAKSNIKSTPSVCVYVSIIEAANELGLWVCIYNC